MPRTPTHSEAVTSLKNAVQFLDELEKAWSSDTDSLDELDTTLKENLKSDNPPGTISTRGAANRALSPQGVREILIPRLDDFRPVMDVPESPFDNVDQFLQEFRRYLIDDRSPDDTFNSRGMTYASASADGGNTGTATFYRLGVDEDDYPLEFAHAETKTFKCVGDQSSAGVDKFSEVLQARGQDAPPDWLVYSQSEFGSGLRASLAAADEDESSDFLRNPSFSDFSGTAPTSGTPTVLSSTDELTGWTVATAANWEVFLDSPTPWRQAATDSVSYALRCKADDNITQVFADELDPDFPVSTPILPIVPIYRNSSATGSVQIDFGNLQWTETIGNLTNNAWNLSVPTLDKNLYRRNWSKNDLEFKITVSSLATSTVAFDGILMIPGTMIDGTWWWFVSDPSAPPMINDKWTFADTEGGTRAKIIYWLWRMFASWRTPPTTASGETISDP